MICWHILGLEPTADTKQIKRAYARILKTIDQEREVEKFQQLRDAYEQAMSATVYLEDDAEYLNEDMNQTPQALNSAHGGFVPATVEHGQTEPSTQTAAANSPDQLRHDQAALERSTASLNSTARLPEAAQVSGPRFEPVKEHLLFNPYASANAFMERVEALYADTDLRNDKRAWQALFGDDLLQDIEVKNLLRYRMFNFVCERIQVADFGSDAQDSISPKVIRFLNNFFRWTEDELVLARQFPTERVDAVMFAIYGAKGVSLNQRVERRTREFSWSSLIGWLMLIFVLTNLFRNVTE